MRSRIPWGGRTDGGQSGGDRTVELMVGAVKLMVGAVKLMVESLEMH